MGSGGGGSSAPAPDPQIGAAALANAETGKQWLSFAKDAYGVQTDRQKPIDALATQVTQQQLDTSKDQQGWAEQAHDRYVGKFEPLQDKFIQQAADWDSAAKEDTAAAAAKADVANAATNVRGQTERSMAAMGVNPNSGRWAGVTRAGDLGTAVSEAGAETGARNLVKSQAIGLQGNAINLGNGLPVQATQSVGLGLNAGTGASNVLNAANGQMLAASGIMDKGFGGAMQGYSNEANILQNQQNSQLQAWEFGQQQNSQNMQGILGGIGSLAGLIMSSKKFKTGRRPATGSLEKLKKMPVQTYKYKNGIADGGAAEHTGPMAEDFQSATGQGDGKTIAAQDAIGLTMGAVNELAGKVDRLHKSIGLGSRVAAANTKKKAA